MSADSHIRYIDRSGIDTGKYDACIQRSPYGLMYASSAWLDAMSKNWDALILGDYEFVMPLTWNTKWAIRYCYQPPLSLQLGIFGHTPPTTPLIETFLEEIQNRFRFAEIFLNHTNALPGLRVHHNYELDLRHPHTVLAQNYKTDLRKNLHRSHRFMLLYSPGQDPAETIALHTRQYGDLTPHVRKEDYDNFLTYCRLAEKRQECILRNISTEDGRLLSSALLLRYKKRLHLLMTTTPPEGRKTQANHFLLDNIIAEFADQDLTLDFVGSDLPGIAHFYENFGAIDRPYYYYRFNNLPWPLRLLKNRQ
jgi:hypothetical protein